MARKGGLESDPKYFDHVSHPLNNVAKAATNNDRPACIVIELRVFVFVIVRMLRPRGQVGKVTRGGAKIPNNQARVAMVAGRRLGSCPHMTALI